MKLMYKGKELSEGVNSVVKDGSQFSGHEQYH